MGKASDLMAAVNAQLKTSALRMGSSPDLVVEYFPTGVIPIDDLLGGGLARGRTVEFFGDYCVTPETKVLTDALTWAPAGELRRGYGLIGFDEEVNQGRGKNSLMKPSEVEHVGNKTLECVRIVTDKGEITTSLRHGLVARHRTQHSREWRLAGDVEVGDSLLWTAEPWHKDRSWDAGYLAGIFDGEGWLDGKRLAFGQLPGHVLDEATAALKRRGFEVTTTMQSTDTGVMRVAILGGRWETMRALGQLGSVRWTARAVDVWSGAGLVSKGPHTAPGSGTATVVAVERVGERDVVTMQTSSRTFIANGFPSHNSTLKSYIGLRAIAEVQALGGVCALIDTEHAYDPTWATELGVDIEELLVPDEIETGEEAVDVTELLIRQKADLIVWDSVAASLPKAEASRRAVESQQQARLAALMSLAMRKLTAANAKTSLMFINQTRVNVGQMFGNPETVPGGKSLPFYASQRIALRKAGKVVRTVNGVKETHGMKVRATLEKSKLNKPHRDVMFIFDLETGDVDMGDYLLTQAVADGQVIHIKSSGKYKFNEPGAKQKSKAAIEEELLDAYYEDWEEEDEG